MRLLSWVHLKDLTSSTRLKVALSFGLKWVSKHTFHLCTWRPKHAVFFNTRRWTKYRNPVIYYVNLVTCLRLDTRLKILGTSPLHCLYNILSLCLRKGYIGWQNSKVSTSNTKACRWSLSWASSRLHNLFLWDIFWHHPSISFLFFQVASIQQPTTRSFVIRDACLPSRFNYVPNRSFRRL